MEIVLRFELEAKQFLNCYVLIIASKLAPFKTLSILQSPSSSIPHPESRDPEGERGEGPAPPSSGVSQVPQASAMLRRSRFLGPPLGRVEARHILEGGASELGLVRK